MLFQVVGGFLGGKKVNSFFGGEVEHKKLTLHQRTMAKLVQGVYQKNRPEEVGPELMIMIQGMVRFSKTREDIIHSQSGVRKVILGTFGKTSKSDWGAKINGIPT